MKFFSRGEKKKVEEVIQKKSDNPNLCGVTGIDYLFNMYGYGITLEHIEPLLAYKLFHTISPLQGSVKKISSTVSELPLVLRNEDKSDEIIKKHPILDLLNKPSSNKTKKQFFSGVSNSVLLTREMGIIARGNVKFEPSELEFVQPYNIDIEIYSTNEWPMVITVTEGSQRIRFTRETIKQRYHYYDKSRMNEFFPYIVDCGDNSGNGGFRGISPLTSLKDELLTYKSSITSNKASIENSGKPSGIITPENDDLDDDQYEALVKSLNEMKGALNRGELVIVPANVKAIFPQWKPSDMEYEQLQNNVKSNIWRLYSIPAPIVNEGSQKFSNFGEAQTAYYDEAINQVWGSISDGLKWALGTRFDLDGWTISYNEFEVPALKNRAVKRMKDLTESKALTTNEIRNSAGYEDTENGENIIVSAKDTTLNTIVDGASFMNSEDD